MGSTAYKQLLKTKAVGSKANVGEDAGGVPRAGDWFTTILNFYQGFNEHLKSALEVYNSQPFEAQRPELPMAEFWKSNGDELLYTFEIQDPFALLQTLIVWKKAVLTFRRVVQQEDLDVKATAWTAGFPVMNTEVVFEDNVSSTSLDGASALSHQAALRRQWYKRPNKGLSRDFIGPSIDTGFRLSQLSTSERMMISLDLAHLIGGISFDGAVAKQLRMYYDGTKPLRGVLGGRPYPHFWIVMAEAEGEKAYELQEAEDELGGRVRRWLEGGQVTRFCEAFYGQNASYLIPPFICGVNNQPTWGKMPDGYADTLKRLIATVTADQTIGERVDKSAKDPGKGAPLDQESILALASEALGTPKASESASSGADIPG